MPDVAVLVTSDIHLLTDLKRNANRNTSGQIARMLKIILIKITHIHNTDRHSNSFIRISE